MSKRRLKPKIVIENNSKVSKQVITEVIILSARIFVLDFYELIF